MPRAPAPTEETDYQDAECGTDCDGKPSPAARAHAVVTLDFASALQPAAEDQGRSAVSRSAMPSGDRDQMAGSGAWGKNTSPPAPKSVIAAGRAACGQEPGDAPVHAALRRVTNVPPDLVMAA